MSLLDSRGLCVFASQYVGSDWSGELHLGAAYEMAQLPQMCYWPLFSCCWGFGCCRENSLFFGIAIVIFGKRGKGGCGRGGGRGYQIATSSLNGISQLASSRSAVEHSLISGSEKTQQPEAWGRRRRLCLYWSSQGSRVWLQLKWIFS